MSKANLIVEAKVIEMAAHLSAEDRAYLEAHIEASVQEKLARRTRIHMFWEGCGKSVSAVVSVIVVVTIVAGASLAWQRVTHSWSAHDIAYNAVADMEEKCEDEQYTLEKQIERLEESNRQYGYIQNLLTDFCPTVALQIAPSAQDATSSEN